MAALHSEFDKDKDCKNTEQPSFLWYLVESFVDDNYPTGSDVHLGILWAQKNWDIKSILFGLLSLYLFVRPDFSNSGKVME